jgi:hypothetical protein
MTGTQTFKGVLSMNQILGYSRWPPGVPTQTGGLLYCTVKKPNARGEPPRHSRCACSTDGPGRGRLQCVVRGRRAEDNRLRRTRCQPPTPGATDHTRGPRQTGAVEHDACHEPRARMETPPSPPPAKPRHAHRRRAHRAAVPLARCATGPHGAAPTGRRQDRRPPRGHPRPVPPACPRWPAPPEHGRRRGATARGLPAGRCPTRVPSARGSAPVSARRDGMAATPGTVAGPWGVPCARPRGRGASRGALCARGTPPALREQRPGVPGGRLAIACSQQRTATQAGGAPRVGRLLPCACDVWIWQGVRARNDGPDGPPACHRHPARQPRTPGIRRGGKRARSARCTPSPACQC